MDAVKKALLPVVVFAKIDIKRLFRDKVAIFFVFFFPLIFLVIFGSISSRSSVSFNVAVLNQSSSDFSKDFQKQLEQNKVFDIAADVQNEQQAREKMSRGQVDATIILPQNFGEKGANAVPSGSAKILYDQNNSQAGQTLSSIITGIFNNINEKLAPSTKPFTVVTESTATKGLSQFDYTFSGLLGFTLLSLGIFGPTQVFPRLKQKGVLRRYRTTTLRTWQYFVANVLSNATVGIIAVGTMFAAAVSLFDLSVRGNYGVIAVVVVLGTVMMYGIGLALGGWAKNENQAAPLAQLVALPMMFLSGVFFPTFLMPELLQNVTRYIPMTAFVDAARFTITENASLIDLAPQIGIMAAWTAVIYFIAFKVFRWE